MNDAMPRPQAKAPKALTPLLEIRNLTKSFDGQHAVDDVNLTIYKGEIFALLGASGCGKSTLLRMLAGFELPTAGQIVLDGVDLARVPPYQRPINMMFQSYALFPHMTVEQNIAFGLKQDKLPKAEINARVQEMLALVHMQEFAKRKPHQLSVLIFPFFHYKLTLPLLFEHEYGCGHRRVEGIYMPAHGYGHEKVALLPDEPA